MCRVLRRFLSLHVFEAVLITRARETRKDIQHYVLFRRCELFFVFFRSMLDRLFTSYLRGLFHEDVEEVAVVLLG